MQDDKFQRNIYVGSEMKWFKNSFGWMHLVLLLAFWGIMFVPFALGPSLKGLRIGLFSVLGPLAGGAIRGWQDCCAEFSLRLLPDAGLILLVGVAMQVVNFRERKYLKALRYFAWIVSISSWFTFAFLSYGHALS